MATSLVLMGKLAAMMIMVLLGILSVRSMLLHVKDSRAFSAITVYVLQPAMIIRAFIIEITAERLNGFLFGLVFSIIVFAAWILGVTLARKPFKLDPISQATMIYGNVGNLTLPIVAMTLGNEMMLYASILQIPFNMFAWTHCEAVIGGMDKIKPHKILLNTNIVALIIGLILMFTGVSLPDVAMTTIDTLANAVPAISMLVIGMVIGDQDLRTIFTNVKSYGVVLGKLVILPAITMGIVYVTGIMKIWPEYVPVLQVIFMGLCAPPASTVSQLAVLYDEHPVDASKYNTLGMFLCIITIPVMNLLFEWLFC